METLNWQIEVPKDVKTLVDGYCAKVMTTRSAVVRSALVEYLSKRLTVHKMLPIHVLPEDLKSELEFLAPKKFELRTSNVLNEKLVNIARTNGISKNQVIITLLEASLDDESLMENWSRNLDEAHAAIADRKFRKEESKHSHLGEGHEL